MLIVYDSEQSRFPLQTPEGKASLLQWSCNLMIGLMQCYDSHVACGFTGHAG